MLKAILICLADKKRITDCSINYPHAPKNRSFIPGQTSQLSVILCPRHDNGRVINVTSVRPSIRTTHQRCPLSKSNSSDQNFMKLDHIVKYHNVFKIDNVPNCTLHSGLLPFVHEIHHFWWCPLVIWITTLRNFVVVLKTKRKLEF